jgi:uncharacterized repeat protein (TIGR03809 family)
MPAKYVGLYFERVVPRWRDLAERRLDYYTELYRSGRWRRYYSEEHFAVRMGDVVRVVKLWRDIAAQVAEPGAADEIRPAA